MAEVPVERLLFVSTYPPTRCGIASFTSALVEASSGVGAGQVGVIRVIPTGDATARSRDSAVLLEVHVDDPVWTNKALSACRPGDVLWVQHEYGIYGREDGVSVVDLARRATVPVMVTLHTVPGAPTRRQREILDDLAETARWLVVMSNEARDRLLRSYGVDGAQVSVIPHGATLATEGSREPTERPIILNWGLIGPGKGLEWGIRAMPLLRHLEPPPLLVIRGATHPNVRRREGEAYREFLAALVTDLRVEDMVDMTSGYMAREDLAELLRRAWLVLLPYDTTDQVTSGVLVEAIGAGIPVIATTFPHSVEMLSGGAGALVPHCDPEAIAAAIARFLERPSEAREAGDEARRLARDLSWSAVAARYWGVARRVSRDEIVNAS